MIGTELNEMTLPTERLILRMFREMDFGAYATLQE